MPWTTNLDLIPQFSSLDVERWAEESSRIPRAVLLKGYSNWIEGYITDIEVRRTEAGSAVRAKSFRSMSKNESPYSIQVEFPSGGDFIGESSCNCKAGLGRCNHQIGLLYTLASYIKLGYKSVPPTISKTSLPQTWHVPSRKFGFKQQPINTLKISKLHPPTRPPKKSKTICDGIIPNIYCPVPVPLPSDQFASDIQKNLAAIGSKCQMSVLLQAASRHPVKKVKTQFGNLPQGSVLTYQVLSLPTTTDEDPFPLPAQPCHYTTALSRDESVFYSGLAVTVSDAQALEKETRGQSTSRTWHRVRSQRLTSSDFKSVVSRVADFGMLAARMQKPKRTIQTQAMKRGLELEPIAAAQYEDITGFPVSPCGFVINPNAPHLGASPDRKVVDSSGHVQGLLEIKCPDVDSFVDCQYLSAGPGGFSLKRSHAYYHQMMGQMGITGMMWCDFFVHCRNDYHMERIHFDAECWKEMKTKLDVFYFEYFLPPLCR